MALSWPTRSARLSTVLLATLVGDYACGTAAALLELACTRTIAAQTGRLLVEVVNMTACTTARLSLLGHCLLGHCLGTSISYPAVSTPTSTSTSTSTRAPTRTPHPSICPASASSTCRERIRGRPSRPGFMVRTAMTFRWRSR
ncbi:hypothetical protein M2271_002616 [Streptomyces sp. LBL]|nr:hypothetical protein [Streptomyces sp. LBL]